jgi:hypothetical protein
MITSETVAPMPNNHSRTTVGVGEEVRLTYSDGPAEWSIATAKDGVVKGDGAKAQYTAASETAEETIIAHGAHSTAYLTFNVIEPDGIVARQAPCSEIFHYKDRPDSGMMVVSCVTPDIVSFRYIDQRELDAPAVGTGVYAYLNGESHGANLGGSPVSVKVVPGLGSLVNTIDEVYSGNSFRTGSSARSFPEFSSGKFQWNTRFGFPTRVLEQIGGRSRTTSLPCKPMC